MNEYLIFNLNTDSTFEKFSPVSIFETDLIEVEEDVNKFINFQGNKHKCVLIQESAFYKEPIALKDIDIDNLEILKTYSWLIDISFGCSPVSAQVAIEKIVQKYNLNFKNLIILANSKNEINFLKEAWKEQTPKFICLHGTELIALKEFTQRDKTKKFLFLSRSFRPSRLIMFLDLKMRGILENSYYSFFNIDNAYGYYPTYYSLAELDNIFQDYVKMHSDNSYWLKNILTYWNDNKLEMFKSFPHTIPEEKEELNGLVGQQVISKSLNNAYSNSFISLCVETNFDSAEEMFMPTEKTFKSILFLQPFLVYTNPLFLDKLKDYGYKSFSPFFDETYDGVRSKMQRIKLINDEAERLNNLDEHDFKKLMYQIDNIVTYNFNVLKNRLNDISNRNEYDTDTDQLTDIFKKNPIYSWFNNEYRK